MARVRIATTTALLYSCCALLLLTLSLCPLHQGNQGYSYGVGIAQAASSVNMEVGPRYPWVAFMSFWNRWCKPGCEIKDPSFVNSRYITHYGMSVSLVVEIKDDIVSSVKAIYADPSQMAGGQRWIKLVESMIRVGTFRWPQDRLEEINELFSAISPQPARYAWQNSSFSRRQDERGAWEFTLNYLRMPVK